MGGAEASRISAASRRGVQFATQVGVLGLACFAITLYALPQYLFPALEPLRIGAVTAALAGVGLLGRWFLGGPFPTGGGLRSLGLLAFVVLAALSPSWSLDPETSRWASGEAMKMALVYVAAASLLTTPERIRLVAWSVALAACVPAYYGLENYLTGRDLLEGYRTRWEGSFYDPNRLAMALVISVLLLLGLRARLRNPFARFIALALVGLQVATIVVTYSRGAVLGLGLGLLILVLASGKARTRSLAAVTALALGVGILAPDTFWNRTGTIASYEEDASAMGRIHAWETAENIILRRPLTGVGAAAFTSAWASYAPGDAGATPYVAHNLFLEVAAELGLVALLGFCVLIFACTRGVFRVIRLGREGGVPEEARALVAAIGGYLVCQLFAGFMLSFFLFLILGMATAVERHARERLAWARRTA